MFSSVLCSQLPLPVSHLSTCPVVSVSLKIWSQIRKNFGLSGPSILVSVKRNCSLQPSKSDPAFKIWQANDISKISDLYTEGIFSSSPQLSSKYNLPSHHLFRFFQIRDYVKKQFPHFPNRPPENLTESLLTVGTATKRSISVLYGLMWSASSQPPTAVRAAWEDGLNIKFEENEWETALSLVHSSSICTRHSLIQCKVLYKIHYTNARLARIFPILSPANHVHMFWSCPKLTSFWTHIFDTLTRAYEHIIVPNPLSAIFSMSLITDLPGAAKQALAFTTLLARKLILLRWKLAHPPSHKHWVKEVLYNLQLEKLRFSLRSSVGKFHKTWDPFLEVTTSPVHPQDLEEVSLIVQ
ncbi:uncharacterized protein LOC131363589 [Hemibagrus wyckioides]|uniref:uncharacterized protein LOC131363589 n=1 Tax=Hemibagrus wyckioides TaxID=337641 RepID=UPI00266C559D|nr:uncharacterized protein LOC131363589 [Hemibagrus wyckioides]